MVVDLDSLPKVSWKQMLMGERGSVHEEGSRSSTIDIVEDLEFLEGDVKKFHSQWNSGDKVFGSYPTAPFQGYGDNSCGE
ncbi:hypothetical protein Goari_023571, partial [Gossypium aridum]|nr:hypothetical protein [Gossypium aridum]